ncbi:hypothetical protein BJ508DRAFT_376735 [Ascobolus immersus RN42]|uniref:Uncharacterized protein n=1 Tax=Ascobolus immersus RN42 TaxID=1160509 RepID=A0A3N4I6F1_ASCIM|nr:hypothetical protein BJ508DRAFT_376735 [Ascobolus immersus RN42]
MQQQQTVYRSPKADEAMSNQPERRPAAQIQPSNTANSTGKDTDLPTPPSAEPTTPPRSCTFIMRITSAEDPCQCTISGSWTSPRRTCPYCGHDKSFHPEFDDGTPAHQIRPECVAPRPELIIQAIKMLTSYGLVQIIGPPGSGKLVLLRKLEQYLPYIFRRIPKTQVVMYPWWSMLCSKGGGEPKRGDWRTWWEWFYKSVLGVEEEEELRDPEFHFILLLDEAEATFENSCFWDGFLKMMLPTIHVGVVMACCYGSGSADSEEEEDSTDVSFEFHELQIVRCVAAEEEEEEVQLGLT